MPIKIFLIDIVLFSNIIAKTEMYVFVEPKQAFAFIGFTT
jgi:hypothetical protein